MKKKIFIILLSIAFTLSALPISVLCSQTKESNALQDDPMCTRIEDKSSSSAKSTSSTGYTHDARFKDYVKYKGVDVSYWNGTINWEKVKKAGYEFAIVRVGYRGTSSKGTLNPDSKAINNIKNAHAAGLKVGVYFFSQALTVAEGSAEANYTLKLIKDYKKYISLPVVFDYEYNDRLKKSSNSKRKKTDICLKFCETVKNAGYTPMVYANYSLLVNDMYTSELTNKGYQIWLAQWISKPTYKATYRYWQYTSNGAVPGISGRTDLNYRYIATPSKPSKFTSSAGYTSLLLKWSKSSAASGYRIYRADKKDGDYKLIKDITSSSTLSYRDTKRASGKQYYYKLRAYRNIDSNKYYASSKGLTCYTKRKNTMYVKVKKSSVYLRSSAGTKYKKVCKLPKGAKFKAYCYTKDKNNKTWYKIKYKKHTGYVYYKSISRTK